MEFADRLDSAYVITPQLLAKSKFDCLEALQSNLQVDLLPQKRELKIKYGLNKLTREVTSLHAEVGLRHAAKYKYFAILHGQVDALWCEDALPSPMARDPNTTVPAIDDELVKACRVARAECAEAFKESGSGSADVVKTTVRRKAAHWISTDSDFNLELAVMDTLTGSGSERRVVEAALAHLPTAAAPCTVQTSYSSISSMTNTSTYRLASRPAQAKHGVIMSVLARAIDGRCAELSSLADDADLRLVKDRMQFFVTCDGLGDKMFGKDALASFYEIAKNKHDAGTLRPEDWDMLVVWSELIEPAKAQEIAEFVTEARKAAGLAMKRSSAPGGRSKPGKKAKASTQDSAVAEAMAMFL